jgi:hypothetical protein
MKPAKYSTTDSRGKLLVDCSECKRGGNGTDKDKCASGWTIKRGGRGGCFAGQLLDDLEVKGETDAK